MTAVYAQISSEGDEMKNELINFILKEEILKRSL
jgi:hypothetical protein